MFPMNAIAQAAFGPSVPGSRSEERFKCPKCGDWFTVDVPDEQGDSNLCLACQEDTDPNELDLQERYNLHD